MSFIATWCLIYLKSEFYGLLIFKNGKIPLYNFRNLICVGFLCPKDCPADTRANSFNKVGEY